MDLQELGYFRDTQSQEARVLWDTQEPGYPMDFHDATDQEILLKSKETSRRLRTQENQGISRSQKNPGIHRSQNT